MGDGASSVRCPAHLPLAGRHNAANALCVAAAALELGVAPEEVASGLGTFGGVGRRLEVKGEPGGVLVSTTTATTPRPSR